MILDLVLYLDESISVFGAVALFDMSNVTWAHGLQFSSPTIIQRSFKKINFLHDGYLPFNQNFYRSVHSWENYSCKSRRMEFVKAPNHINMFLNTFRFFMSSKMKERLIVTSGLPTVEANLPTNLGGTSESYTELASYWKMKAQEYAPWFLEQEQYKMNLDDVTSN